MENSQEQISKILVPNLVTGIDHWSKFYAFRTFFWITATYEHELSVSNNIIQKIWIKQRCQTFQNKKDDIYCFSC